MGKSTVITAADIKVVNAFIEDTLKGREALAASPRLRAETISGVNQLICKTEGVLANAPVKAPNPQFQIRLNTTYLDYLSQALAARCFIPHDALDRSKPEANDLFIDYELFQVPPSYKLYCTQAQKLWRIWWLSHKHRDARSMLMNAFVRCRSTWYQLREVAVSNQLIYITTLGSEQVYHPEDLLFWLNKRPVPKQML
jgi:hypothetical protein